MVLVTSIFFTEKLLELASLYGIQVEYKDFAGEKHTASKDVILKILHAMGVNAETPKQVEIAIQKFKLREARKRLKEVFVFDEDSSSIDISFNIENEEKFDFVEWEIELEDKQIIKKKVKKSSLISVKNFEFNKKIYLTYVFPIKEKLPFGYHTLTIKTSIFEAKTRLIYAPRTCYMPSFLQDGQKLWGISAQMYSLRSYWNWGIGDYSDLKKLITIGKKVGADFIGCNPLHIIEPCDVRGQSPYYPTSRNALEIMYIDFGLTQEFQESNEVQNEILNFNFQQELKSLQSMDLVDYARVRRLKMYIARILYKEFKEKNIGKGTEREKAFNEFCKKHIGAFKYALFQSIEKNLNDKQTKIFGFSNWPQQYKNPLSDDVKEFAKVNQDEINFNLYLQFLAHEQLTDVKNEARKDGLKLGIYLDLALSARKDGAESWVNQEIIANGISIGAPPDFYNLDGQDWNLGCWNPHKLQKKAFEPYIQLLRDQMEYANILRIDHVMQLMRLYWIPDGNEAKDGAYVTYPMKELMGIIALESQRHQCLIIGEDMGTVDDEIREEMKKRNMFSYKVLIYEKMGTTFKEPSEYPQNALVVTSVHDSPPLKAFWYAEDITVRKNLNIFDEKSANEFYMSRAKERESLALVSKKQRIYLPEANIHGEFTNQLNIALHSLASSMPCSLMLTTLDDLIESNLMMNLPGTYEEYPNWRHKLLIPLEEIFDKSKIYDIANTIKEWRNR